MLRRLTLAAWMTLGLVGPAPASAAETTLPLDVRLMAREVAPGEPVRVVVGSPKALSRLAGRFLNDAVHLSPSADGRTWTGWTMVGLDVPAQMAAFEVRGEDLSGNGAAGTRAVTIRDKPFPEEQLTVKPRYVEPPPEVTRRLAKERARLDAIYLRRSPIVAGADPFRRPVAGGPTSVFGTRRVFNGVPRSPHSGLDLRADTGTVVRASGPGTVVLAMDLYYSGNTVILDHGGGLFTLYAHLSRIDIAENAVVAAGDRLGLSGATGRVTGPHLHWGAKIGPRPFDPSALTDPRVWR